MSFEHTLDVEYEAPIPFTCANGTGIEKGTVLKLADPMTVSKSSGSADIIAGIAGEEKIASNGTTIGVYRRGRFKAKISGSVTVGDALVTSTTENHLASATAFTQFQISGTRIVGYALETGTTGETIFYELQPTAVNGA